MPVRAAPAQVATVRQWRAVHAERELHRPQGVAASEGDGRLALVHARRCLERNAHHHPQRQQHPTLHLHRACRTVPATPKVGASQVEAVEGRCRDGRGGAGVGPIRVEVAQFREGDGCDAHIRRVRHHELQRVILTGCTEPRNELSVDALRATHAMGSSSNIPTGRDRSSVTTSAAGAPCLATASLTRPAASCGVAGSSIGSNASNLVRA